MIVGISGVAGSGKDTAAGFLAKNHGFARMGLADPLKRICKGVFGFTDEQLWGPSEKRNAPDARYQRKHTFPHPYEQNVCPCCGWDRGTQLRDGSPQPQCYLTPRYALQQLGTEWGRRCYDDVWIDHGINVANGLLLDSKSMAYSAKTGLHDRTLNCGPALDLWNTCYTNVTGVAFSDIRFKNEMAAIKKAGGLLWRLKRGKGLGGEAGLHQSEVEQLEIPDSYFDMVIDNNDISLEELEKRVTVASSLSSGAFV